MFFGKKRRSTIDSASAALATVAAEDILAVLAKCVDADSGRDYVALRAIHDVVIDGDHVSLTVRMPYPAKSQAKAIIDNIKVAVQTLSNVKKVAVKLETQIEAHSVQRGVALLSGVKNIIAVASGKGGVGKSTTAVNLALALSAEGAKVGLLDADIYGPSQPMMLGLLGKKPESPDGKTMLPLQAYGLQTNSIGFLVDVDQPMVWRGPMVSQALMQLCNETRWQNLDYLVVDLPPGTGDIQLTLSQKVPITGAVIVTTPQDIALLDARKAFHMFEKVGITTLGIVENMAAHVCSECGHVDPIFGDGGGKKMAKEQNLMLFGQLPLDLSIRRAADGGKPSVVAQPEGKISEMYLRIARKVAAKIAECPKDFSHKLPKVVSQ